MASMPGMAVSCPSNATFYACDFGERFFGCCENGSPADTCTNGCPQEHLLPASFEKQYYSYVTRAACTTGDWWSCADTAPPFLGCCSSNPCLSGCPPSELSAAIFSQNQTDNPLYSAISYISATTSSTASSSTGSSTPVLSTGAAHSSTTSPLPVHKTSTGRVVGGAVGGIVGVAGIILGVLLLYRRLKSQGHQASNSTGTIERGGIKDIVSPNPTGSQIYNQRNEASPEYSTATASPHEESKVSIRTPRPTKYASYIHDKTPSEICSTSSGVPPEDQEVDKTPQELPPNYAPIPEIASSDIPQPCHELPLSDPAVEEHVHPKALQPGRASFRPYSASSLSPAPQPHGHASRPHSPSQLSVVSSGGSSPPLAPGMSPISVTKDDVSAVV